MEPNYSLQRPDYALQTGWTPIPHAVVRVSNNTISILCNRSTYISVGDKILLTQTTDKYFEVTNISVVGNTTTITLSSPEGSVVSTDTIYYSYFSKNDRPYGYTSVGRFKAGSFLTPHGADPDVQSVTGIGFKPKAIVFLGVCGQTPSAENGIGVGITDGTSSFSIVGYTVDGGASGGEGPTANTVFQQIDTVGAITMSANLTSMDVDGFTLLYSSKAVNPYVIAYLAMG
jgi:hypothetical protein